MKKITVILSEPVSPIIERLLAELTKKGFLDNGILTYDEKDEGKLQELFDNYYQQIRDNAKEKAENNNNQNNI
ncbi:MAG: hypothetical protein IKG90_07220 [Bacteroidales bacterium]|nr:hypothetical protein [Bacteroidales bacterium]MBR6883147.1 hypothetical protein [Bacteroidales bacterium]